MQSNLQSRIITPKIRRLSRRTCRVPVLPYQRQGRKLWTPGRGNRRLSFSLGELGEWLLPENTCRRVRRSEEKQGEQKKVCHLNHRCWWGGRKDGLLRIHMHVVQIRDWIGLFLKLRKSRSLKIGGGVEARLTCNTCSLPFQRALYSSLSNHFPLFEYVALFLHILFPRRVY